MSSRLFFSTLSRNWHNRFVEWTHDGGQHGSHSSALSAPLWPIHGRRYAY